MVVETLCVLLRMAGEVDAGTLTVGDFVLINAYLLQIFGTMASLSL